MSDIKDFRFRDQLAQISPNCETSFLFRSEPQLLPLDCAFTFRDQSGTIPAEPCTAPDDGDVWGTPDDGDTWGTPDGNEWGTPEVP